MAVVGAEGRRMKTLSMTPKSPTIICCGFCCWKCSSKPERSASSLFIEEEVEGKENAGFPLSPQNSPWLPLEAKRAHLCIAQKKAAIT